MSVPVPDDRDGVDDVDRGLPSGPHGIDARNFAALLAATVAGVGAVPQSAYAFF
jgi:hypothetical protein